MLAGGCFCGAIRYEAAGPASSHALCHCEMCRRTTGAPCVAWFTVARSAYRLLSGTPTSFRSSTHGTRTFCPACGTQLTFADDASPDEVDVTTCSLDDPALAPPASHIYVHSQVPWLALADGLPRHQRSRAESPG